VSNCTVADNGSGVYLVGSAEKRFLNTIIVRSTEGPSVQTELSTENPVFTCCNIYGNAGGDWVECTANPQNSGNFSADPRFCDTINGDYHIDGYSPCAPAYSPCGELVGALGVGCQSSYICGDANISGGVDIDDIVYVIEYIFAGGFSPIPYESANADCSGGVDIDDIVYLITYVFGGGPAPCDVDGDGVPDC
jgi:hypothetical protein